MKILLEDKIKWDLDFFEEEPETGHAGRFAAKLERNRKKKVSFKRYLLTIGSVAAIFILWIYLFPISSGEEMCRNELCEVQRFYSTQLMEEAEKLEEMVNNDNKQFDRQFKQDIKSLLNDEDISEIPNMTEEEKIAFIIQYYNTRIESLKHIKEIIQNS